MNPGGVCRGIAAAAEASSSRTRRQKPPTASGTAEWMPSRLSVRRAEPSSTLAFCLEDRPRDAPAGSTTRGTAVARGLHFPVFCPD